MTRIYPDGSKIRGVPVRFQPGILLVLFCLMVMAAGVSANPLPPPDQLPDTPDPVVSGAAAGLSSPMQWTQVTPHAQFSARQGHSTVVFNNSLWVIGGMQPASPEIYYSEVWRSENGKNWTEVTPDGGFGGRAGHRSVVFDNRIWIIGGRDGDTKKPLNDVWYSSDGITWHQATAAAPFAPRWSFGLTVSDGRMWVIGGSANDGTPVNDVWYSSDGITWIQASPHAGFSPRMDLSATTFGGKIWVTGGFDWSRHFNDLWSTGDGNGWTEVSDHATYPERRYQKTEVADDRMWIIGGIGGDTPYNWRYLTDVWYSPDGKTWTRATEHAGFPGRYEFTTAVFNNRLWVIGGTSGNDIWCSDELSPDSSLPEAATVPEPSGGILVTKTVFPSSIKEGVETAISISIVNRGPAAVRDVEVLDSTHPAFQVTGGTVQGSYDSVDPGKTRTLTYRVRAVKAGSFRLNRTTVMYADGDGNYQLAYSGYPEVRVLPSLLAHDETEPGRDYFDDLVSWINGFDPFS